MAYNITYKKSVAKDLARVDRTETRRILNKIEKELATHADSFPALKGEFAGLRKMRIGDYRVIFAILGEDILVLRIGHRKDIYR